MPLIIDGQGYREAVQETYEAQTIAQVRAIPNPSDRDFCFVGAADGSGEFRIYRFNRASLAPDDGDEILAPDNPYILTGRWYKMPVASAAGGGAVLTGSGSPTGTVDGELGQLYVDNTNGALYMKLTALGDFNWTLLASV